MVERIQQSSSRRPTLESLKRLQKLLTTKLNRELTPNEVQNAYNTLMDFAFALVDMAPKESLDFLEKPIANK